MEKVYNNKELAQDYFSVSTQYAGKQGRINSTKIKGIITELNTNIATFYQEYGNLTELKVEGIGIKTKRTLELILEKGVEEARKLIKKEKEEQMSEGFWDGIPSKIEPDTDERDYLTRCREGDFGNRFFEK